MQPLLDASRRWYRIYVRASSYLGDLLLLLVRVYWGSLLVESGWNKFANLHQTAAYFESLGIFWPKFNALLSGGAELGCGALLVIGLAARVAAVPLVVNMLAAFIANSGNAIRHLFTNANDFVNAPEFLFLFACLLVLVFGPGMISLDGLLGNFLGRVPAESRLARVALRGAKTFAASAHSDAATVGGPEGVVPHGGAPAIEPPDRNRREFAKLTGAAFAGLIAGILIRRAQDNAPNPGKPEATSGPAGSAQKGSQARDNSVVATDGKAADNKRPPPGTDLDLLLADDTHVCRGLNTCRGKDKKHDNSCAGRGSCATVESHACNGQNACKGQGGCDSTAGINLCKGQGACAVPLKETTWKLARARFEQLARTKRLDIGAAPEKG